MDAFGVVLAHGGGLLPDHDQLMIVMSFLPLLLIGTVLLANALHRRQVFGGDERTIGLRAPLAAIAAGLSIGAAAIHFSVIQHHFQEFVLYGYAFIGLAWFQAIWAPIHLLRSGTLIALLGAAVNAGAVVVWLITRISGMPFGPDAGIPQPAGFADLLATSFEAALVVILAAPLRPAWAHSLALRQMPVEKAFVLVAFCVTTTVLLTVLALAGTTAEVLAAL